MYIIVLFECVYHVLFVIINLTKQILFATIFVLCTWAKYLKFKNIYIYIKMSISYLISIYKSKL